MLINKTPVDPAKATGTLTFTGGGVLGDQVTIVPRTYRMGTSPTAIAGVDTYITVPSSVTKAAATSTLTFTDVPADGETVTLGTRIYEFDTDATVADGHIKVDLSGESTPTTGGAITALVAAITADTEAVVTAVDGEGDTVTLTCKVEGSVGNSTATTTTCANATLTSTHLTGGVDMTADEAIALLVTAINADSKSQVTAAAGEGTTPTLEVTAKVDGAAYNGVYTHEVCANAAWGHAHLENGATGTLAKKGSALYYDEDYVYIPVADNTFKKIALVALSATE